MLTRIRIVLHQPTGPANVGAVARIMANMGLRDLVLVAPKHPTDHPDSVAYAAHGADLLSNARTVTNLDAALDDCVRTYATSAKHGLYRRQAVITPRAAAEEAAARLPAGPVAIAFGPERTGFDVRDLLRFDRLVSIPADENYPVLNLAAAVTVCVYELRLAVQQQTGATLLPQALDHGLAPDQRKQILFEKLFDALDRIGFFSEQSPDKLKYGLRHCLGRLDLSIHEADVLIGMAQQIRWYAEQYGPQPPGD